MYKLDQKEDLEKAGQSLGSFFAKQADELQKTHALHAALAAHHQGKADAHSAYAVHFKAQHDALPDDHDMKAHMAKGHSHHVAMAAHEDGIAKAHGAHAETVKTQIDAIKALSVEWGGVKKADEGPLARLLSSRTGTVTAPVTAPTGNVMVDMINETSTQLMAKTLSMMDNDPDVQKAMREHVMKLVAEAVGSTVRPPEVSAVAPTAPAFGIKAVTRPGQRPLPAADAPASVPLEFSKLFSSEDGDQGLLRQ
jgi:hypothetical protein